MRYASFRRPDGTPTYGRLDGDRLVDLGEIVGAPADLKAAIATGALAGLAGGASCAMDEAALLPVIPNPAKILCVGLNYETHRKETGRAEAHPAIFTAGPTLVAHKRRSCVRASRRTTDFEGGGSGNGRATGDRGRDAFDVAGYSCFNDASCATGEAQHPVHAGQDFGTGAFGPYGDADEIAVLVPSASSPV